MSRKFQLFFYLSMGVPGLIQTTIFLVKYLRYLFAVVVHDAKLNLNDFAGVTVILLFLICMTYIALRLAFDEIKSMKTKKTTVIKK